MRFLTAYAKSEKGIAAIEMVLVAPVLLFMLFGTIDLTALLTANRKLSSVANAVGTAMTQYQTTVYSSNATDIMNLIGLIMQPTAATNVHVDIYDYYLNGANVQERWRLKSASGPTCAAPVGANYQYLMTASTNDVLVTVSCMTFTPYVATLLGTKLIGATSFSLSSKVATRPRGSQALNCTNDTGAITCGM